MCSFYFIISFFHNINKKLEIFDLVCFPNFVLSVMSTYFQFVSMTYFSFFNKRSIWCNVYNRQSATLANLTSSSPRVVSLLTLWSWSSRTGSQCLGASSGLDIDVSQVPFVRSWYLLFGVRSWYLLFMCPLLRPWCLSVKCLSDSLGLDINAS